MPKANIKFELDKNNRLTVKIETEKLYMESVTPSCLPDYSQLLGASENMAKFADGSPLSVETTQQRVTMWLNRWNNNDPFSALSVFKKGDGEFKGGAEFIGYTVLGYGSKPGSAELAYTFDQKFWGQGYGKETVTTVVKNYAPKLVEQKYKVGKNEFTSIVATTRSDHEASIKILKAAGMKQTGQEVSYGHNRYHFFVSTADLMQTSSDTQAATETATPQRKI